MKKVTTLFISMILLSVAFAQQMPETFFYSGLETGFIENMGQVKDQHGKTNNDVRFIYSDGLFNLQLKSDGFSYELFEVVNKEGNYSEWDLREQESDEPSDFKEEDQQLRSHRIDVKVLGAGSSVEIVAQDATEATFNFYTSNVPESGITGVHSYKQVMYKNIYAGIDLVFYAPDTENESPLKYEWIVHPGAHPEKIRLQYNGTVSLAASAAGGFQLITSLGTIDESKVIAYYQDDLSPVPASYRFDGNRVSYDLTAAKNKTLVIDPNIIWSTYFGGVGWDNNRNGDITTNSKNQAVIVGITGSAQYIATTGAFQTTYGGGSYDGFLAQFSKNGKLLWATYFGSTKVDRAVQVVVDFADNIFVGGDTESTSGIATEGAYQTVLGGHEDVFIAKFTSSGIRLWSTYLGGDYDEEVYGLACDSYGSLYFSGYTVSFESIATPGAHQTVKIGSKGDGIIGQFRPDGQLAWCSYHGASESDRAHSLALGVGGYLYMQGTTLSTTQFASPGTHQTVYGGGEGDSYVSKWDTNGNFIWCTYYGGEDEDHGRKIVADQYGNVYAVGFTVSATGISTPGAVQPDWYEAYFTDGLRVNDGYIAKFDADGSLVWGTYYGGSGSDEFWGLTIDLENEIIYPAGRSFSPENISTPGSFQPEYSGTSDAVLAKFTFDGARIWGTYIGVEAGEEELFSVAQDKQGYLYLYMRTDSVYSVTPDAYQSEFHGKYDVILARFSIADACYDVYEPNNSITVPKLLKTFSDTLLYGYTAAIADTTDEDWYKIKIPEDAVNLKIELTDLPADYDLKLYKVNGQLVQSSSNPGTADESIIFNNVPKLNYRIAVTGNGGTFEPNACYRIKPMVSAVPWPQKQGDDDFGSLTGIFQVHVFPNPCSDQLNMKITSDRSEKIQVTLFNLVHQSMIASSFEIKEGTQALSIPVNQLPAGMYLLEIVQNGKKITSKVVVQ